MIPGPVEAGVVGALAAIMKRARADLPQEDPHGNPLLREEPGTDALYAGFRSKGLFIDSGIVEAGC